MNSNADIKLISHYGLEAAQVSADEKRVQAHREMKRNFALSASRLIRDMGFSVEDVKLPIGNQVALPTLK